MFEQAIINQMRTAKYGNRSYTKQLLSQIKEQEKEPEVVDAILEVICFGLKNAMPLTGICRTIANRIFYIMGVNDEPNDRKTIRLGADAIDWTAQTGIVAAEKFKVMDNGGQEQYFLVITDDAFATYVKNRDTGSLKANLGYTPWRSPVLKVGDRRIDIVKNARRYNLLSNYRYSEMPEVYSALNKLHETEWHVNKAMLRVLEEAVEKEIEGFIPKSVSTQERKDALAAINKADRTALWLSEIKFKQLMEAGFSEGPAEGIAAKAADEFQLKAKFDHLAVISEWSKRMDLDRCIKLANEYGDDVLNYLFNCDSRGRVYSLQHGLNPQGADFAKALLQFANPKPISTYDFFITIANHAGQDKKAYSERTAWVQENEDMLYLIGTDPWCDESVNWMVENGIDREQKSRYQFIACCIELARLIDHLEAGGSQDDFLCVIPVAYDATNSGLQILSLLGRDEVIAPYVNIVPTEAPGDVYQYIGDKVADTHSIEPLKAFKAGEKIWRKICKRGSMCFGYSSKAHGMGQMQWEDRKSYGSPITDNLTVKECRELGAELYKMCDKHLLGASALMKTMQQSVKNIEGSIVSWKLPSGFTAFQVKDKSKADRLIDVPIGNNRVNLVFYSFTNTPHKMKHANAIAPDIVHSFDAWLLVSIVSAMPHGANLAMVHDQFGSDSCHGEDIQSMAKVAYEAVCCREVLELVLYQVAGEEVSLPEAGKLDVKEIRNADYVVC